MVEAQQSRNESTDETGAVSAPVAARRMRADEAGLLGLFDVLILLVRERRIILWCVALGLVGGGLAMLKHGMYAATTSVLPPQNSINSSLLGQFGSLGGLAGATASASALSGPRISQDLYVSLLQSNSVEDAVVKRFRLDRQYHIQSTLQARNLVHGLCEVDGTGRDGLIRVTMHDSDAKRAAELANGYVDEFKHFVEHLAITEAAQRRTFFETQLAQERNNLTQAEENLRKTEQGSGGIEVDAQTRALVESAANLRAQIAAKEVQLQSIRTYAGPQNVNLLRAQQELAELRAQLAKISNSGSDIDDSLLVSRKDVPQSQIANLRATRDLKYHETMYQLLSNQYQAARLDEVSEGSPVQVIDPAQVPEIRSGPGRKLKLVYGFLLGLLAGLMVVIGRHSFRKLRDEPLLTPKFAAFRAALRPGR